MCGIAGVLGDNRRSIDLHEVTTRLGATLVHRGPDDGGVWLDKRAGIGLAHRRLSIVDLSSLGRQPMVSSNERYVISYNGEIYNFKDLRQELIERKARFRSRSDTEVILAGIETWGLKPTIERLIGMFAFAVWDQAERVLTLVRDRLGIKPLYWGEIDGTFVFGSELKALIAYSSTRPTVDRNALAAYARWNYVPTPHSIFEGIHKLAPGTSLEVRAGQRPKIERYWDLRAVAQNGVANPLHTSDQEATNDLEGLLLDAVERRMVADVPVGAFLSGGIDSSLVVALMQARSRIPVRTFTIGFQDEEFDEAPFAKAVSEHLGTDHTELYVDYDDALSVVPRLAHYYDEPFADSSQIPTMLVAELTRKSVTVSLSGDGGDELFAGYTRYLWADMLRRRFGRLPRRMRNGCAILAAAGSSLTALVQGPATAGPIGEFGVRLGKLAGFLREPNENAIYRRQHSHWKSPNTVVLGGFESHEILFGETGSDEIEDFISRMQFMDTTTYLPDDILTKLDRATMSVGLEARVPLLDHRIVELAWRLPMKMKVRGGEGKWLFRQVLARYVPARLTDRPKRGFGVPIAAWLRGPLRDWAEDLINEPRLRNEGYFDAGIIRKTWEQFIAGRNSEHDAIWGILMFQAWHDLHMTGKYLEPATAFTRAPSEVH